MNSKTIPTQETYQEWADAFAFFNAHLFDNALAQPLLTLAREKRTFGYFSANRFISDKGLRAPELAMNPAYFATRPIEDTLSTLVHEMVHQWQSVFGAPGRKRYHNREWADKMIEIGLHPSDTGAPGGKEVGESMSHYIIPDGLFQRTCVEFLRTSSGITWFDVFSENPKQALTEDAGLTFVEDPKLLPAATTPQGSGDVMVSSQISEPVNASSSWETPPSVEAPILGANDNSAVLPASTVTVKSLPPAARLQEVKSATEESRAALAASPAGKQTRERYVCGECGVKVWGKPGLNLICGTCNVNFKASSAEGAAS